MTRKDDDAEQFENEFRRWALRPLSKPAHAAARDVVQRVADTSSPRSRLALLGLTPMRGAMVAASLALAIATASYVYEPGVPRREVNTRGVQAPSGSDRVRDADIVVLLDDGTPVHVFLPGDPPVSR